MTDNLITQGEAIKELYDERIHLSKNRLDTSEIDAQIDKVLGQITLHKNNEKVVSLFNGVRYKDITQGGTFESEHGEFKVQHIEGNKIKINGNWYYKSEFEPAFVTKFKGKLKGKER